MKRLGTDFFQREDVVQIAQDLLGKVLVSDFEGVRTSGIIVETEAYRAPEDKASHAYQNRRTKRTEVMFWQGGTAYVYLCYGIHHLFNIVTAPPDMAHAVLIRALEPFEGIKYQKERRKTDSLRNLSSGPGKLTVAMGIIIQHSGLSLVSEQSPIWIEDHERILSKQEIVKSSRIGIDYAEECVSWPWRFTIKDNQFVSK